MRISMLNLSSICSFEDYSKTPRRLLYFKSPSEQQDLSPMMMTWYHVWSRVYPCIWLRPTTTSTTTRSSTSKGGGGNSTLRWWRTWQETHYHYHEHCLQCHLQSQSLVARKCFGKVWPLPRRQQQVTTTPDATTMAATTTILKDMMITHQNNV